MTKITCSYCKQEATVNMHFSEVGIVTQHSYIDPFSTPTYRACVTGKAICPCCGKENRTTYSQVITNEDIIVLAGAIHKGSGRCYT